LGFFALAVKFSGASDFVESVHELADETMERKSRLATSGYDFNEGLFQLRRCVYLNQSGRDFFAGQIAAACSGPEPSVLLAVK
jgi:hypothetical protein